MLGERSNILGVGPFNFIPTKLAHLTTGEEVEEAAREHTVSSVRPMEFAVLSPVSKPVPVCDS
jgi:hypothetical protein